MHTRELTTLLALVLSTPGCFNADVAPNAFVKCARTEDCPAERVCFLNGPTGICVAVSTRCIEFKEDVAVPEVDGTPCGEALICVAAACVEPRCGDGVVSGQETCDGSAGCRADCTRCGDGVIGALEQCDNGAQNNDVEPGACRESCVLPVCGDGVRDPGEGCDDGSANSDVEPDACRTSCARATCGDGVVDDGEECDDGTANSDAPNACRPTCARAACGDGVQDEGESCDNGASNSDVRQGACRSTCIPAACGDGVRDPGEGCDDGASNSDVEPDACRSDCRRASCGDGVLDEDEECDDGARNGDDPDACRTTCARAACGDGVLDRAEQCDNGANNSDVDPGACRTTCAPARCGDSVLDPGEQCDDGLANSAQAPNACRPTCVRATCSDGVLDGGEVCDDGNAASGDGCRGDCLKVEVCGDGILDTGEACDDANGNPLDGCAQCRLQEWGRELVVSGAVATRVATQTSMQPWSVASDPLGRVYVADQDNRQVHRLNLDGTITTIAGSGAVGFSGDGGPATSAAVDPLGVFVDTSGRVLIADAGNHRIRRVNLDGTITTIAGTGTLGFSGDAGPATIAELNSPEGIAVDAVGRVIIADTGNQRIRRVDLDGRITTIAGTGAAGFSGDGGPATGAALSWPQGVTVDGVGRVVIADTDNNRIRRIELEGTITTIAGTGAAGFAGDDGPATSAALQSPRGVAVGDDERVVIADTKNDRIRRFEVGGNITTIAGTGTHGFSGDGGPATSAALKLPYGVAIDQEGRVIIADNLNKRLRRVEFNGTIPSTITTIGGTGGFGFSSDGGPATSAALLSPRGLAVDDAGRVIIAETFNNRIRRIELDGTITSIAGTGATGFSGDGAPATTAALSSPHGVTIDADERVLIADTGNHCIRRIEADGTITTIAGTGADGFSGDGGAATSAALNAPRDVAVDADGRVVIADTNNNRVRRIALDGKITTIAGAGTGGFSGDGGAATSAALHAPNGVAIDAADGVVIADTNNNRIRRIEPNGKITTIAGTGVAAFSGDDGPATSAALHAPRGVAVDADGRVVIADTDNHRIRRFELGGTITTLAGTGALGFSGDGGPADSAALNAPRVVAVDDAGLVIIADTDNRRIGRIGLDDTVTTIGGQVHPSGPGPVARARLYGAISLTRLPDETLVSVGDFGRVLAIDSEVRVVLGYDLASPAAFSQAPFAPLLADARGSVLDPIGLMLIITEHATGDLRVVQLDVDEDGVIDTAALWTNASVTTTLAGPAGIVYDEGSDDFIVADESDHCVRRIGRDGEVGETVFGRCGAPGLLPGFLTNPTHVVVSPATGAVYIADTGNHRVLRVQGGTASVVIGDGSVSSAGEGAPARLFPVNAPRQLALDAFGNLYVTSTTTLRLVANIDGDADADGDDLVTTVFGGGPRDSFPESDAFCLNAITLGDDGSVYATDACQGYLVRLFPTGAGAVAP